MSLIRDILILCFLTVVVIFTLFYLRREGFIDYQDNNVSFMTKDQTYKFLHNDLDGYIANLSPIDLYARKVNSSNTYRLRAANSALDFSNDLKMKLVSAVKTSNRLLEKIRIEKINCSEIASMPWIFALTDSNLYEDGLPHTRANVIFISSTMDQSHNNLVKTLIHEKIHIYQRAHPDEISFYLESKGYIKSKHGQGIPYIRSNPDLDGWIYYSPVTKKEMAAYYSSDEPSSITDITLTDPSFEHPYELMAYTITEKVISN